MTNETPLQSWKEIGAYLQRDSTTARRWEKEEGLPVHRHTHKSRSSVYAYPSEIDAWRVGRTATSDVGSGDPTYRWPAFALTVALCLVMVGNGIRPVSAQQSGSLTKRLCAACSEVGIPASISSDGNWLATTDGDVVIKDIAMGQVRKLTTHAFESREGAVWSLLSPDAAQALYLWDMGEPPTAGRLHFQLRVVANQTGSTPRVLADSPENLYYERAAWSPDGKSVVVIISKQDNTWQIASIPVASGAVTMLKSLDWRLSGMRSGAGLSLSPDGRFIAYAALAKNPKAPPARPDVLDEHIYVLAADGSSETEIVKSAGINENPVWTPDGRHILFISDRSGGFDLWSVAVSNGKAAGSPTVVTKGIGRIRTAGMTRSGSYYYAPEQTNAVVANIAELTAGSPARIAESFAGVRPAWSPDGKSVAFKRQQPGARTYNLVVRTLATGEERTFPTDLGATGQGQPQWFHDGKSILTSFAKDGAPPQSYRVDLTSGALTKMRGQGGVLSPDDKTLYSIRHDPNDSTVAMVPDSIVAIDVGTGQEKKIFTFPAPGPSGLAVSPDSRALVIWWNNQLAKRRHFARVAADGGGYREIYDLPWLPANASGNVTWTQDGKNILFDRMADENTLQIMRFPADGGTPQFTGLEITGRLQNLDLSPDGSRIAFSRLKVGGDIWALDNVLASLPN